MTVFVAMGSWLCASFVRAKPGQLSVTVGLPKFTPVAKHWFASVLVVTSSGQAMVGRSFVRTPATRVQLAPFPLASVTVQVTVLVPIGNWLAALLVMANP